jgi:hypothetical protein
LIHSVFLMFFFLFSRKSYTPLYAFIFIICIE